MFNRWFGPTILVAFLWGSSGPLAGQPAELKKPEALGYFLLNCAYNGTWPATTDWRRSNRLCIGILGKDDDRVQQGLEKSSPGKPSPAQRAKATWLKGGPIEVKQSDSPADLLDCQIVYVGRINPDETRAAYAAFKGRAVLLVGMSESSLACGAVELRIGPRVEYDVHLDRLTQSRVTLSSKFLRSATRTWDGGKPAPLGQKGGLR